MSQKSSLTALAREQLELARAASSGRSAHTVFGGHEHVLHQAAYRVRYCGSGLDAGHAADVRGEDDPVVDRYLLQFWPAPPGPDVVVRCSSEHAVYWHGYARGLPSRQEQAAARAAAVRLRHPRRRPQARRHRRRIGLHRAARHLAQPV